MKRQAGVLHHQAGWVGDRAGAVEADRGGAPGVAGAGEQEGWERGQGAAQATAEENANLNANVGFSRVAATSSSSLTAGGPCGAAGPHIGGPSAGCRTLDRPLRGE